MKADRWVVPALLLLAACAGGPPGPATLDTRSEACRSCRMTVSDAGVAAQLVAPLEEPLFFDDIGCLRSYLAGNEPKPGGRAFVADHRTKTWVPATRALYTRCATLETPMGSRLVAHADATSREADPATRDGVALSPADLFGPGGPPDGR